MLSKAHCCVLSGIDAIPVKIEIDISQGLFNFQVVGLPDTSVKESIDRIGAGLKNSGLVLPKRRIVVNLSPGDVPKTGPGFDLPVALGLLAVSGQIPQDCLEEYMVIGELGLDGEIRRVNGVLPMALSARRAGFKKVIVPHGNAMEASLVGGLDVYAPREMAELALHLTEEKEMSPFVPGERGEGQALHEVDLTEVKGQEAARRALEVAASGGHNALMIGPPGSGKTMLARRLPTILPPLSEDESLEVTKIHSIMGMVSPDKGVVLDRQFRAPHHTVSSPGLVGGGTIPRPGEVSLAHMGVLFLDELPEFRRQVLEVLRQPMEDGKVTISRAQANLTFPSRFMLVAAMNPCPCGYMGDSLKQCSCSPMMVERYRQRISGPLMDRIDIHMEVPRVQYDNLADIQPAEASAVVRGRVIACRARQIERFKSLGYRAECNAQLRPREIEAVCVVPEKAKELLRRAVDKLGMSARAYNRVLKLARTIADMDAREEIRVEDVAEAIQYRQLDRARTVG